MIRLAGSVVAVLLASLSAALIQGDAALVILTAISSGVFIAQAGYVLDWLAQAQHRNWIPSVAQTSASICSGLVKMWLIIWEADLVWFALSNVAEAALASLAMFALFRSRRLDISFRFDGSLARTMLTDALPLVISGFAFFIYTRMDLIMLGRIAGENDVGNYSAALRIGEAIGFIPLAFITVGFPKWVRLFGKDRQAYERNILIDFRRIVVISLVISSIVSLSAQSICQFLYGDRFDDASDILVVSAWISALSVWGFASSRLIIIEGNANLIVYRNLAGIAVNFVGNAILIPILGAVGSALSTVTAYLCANFLFYAFSSKLRPLLILYMRCFLTIPASFKVQIK